MNLFILIKDSPNAYLYLLIDLVGGESNRHQTDWTLRSFRVNVISLFDKIFYSLRKKEIISQVYENQITKKLIEINLQNEMTQVGFEHVTSESALDLSTG